MCWTQAAVGRLSVDEERLVADLHGVAGPGDRALDEHVAGVDVVARLLEDDDVAAVHVAVREEPRQRRQPRRVGELVDEQVVADEDRRLHRAGRDLVGLDDERPDEEDEDAGDEERLVPLARRGVRGRARRRVRGRLRRLSLSFDLQDREEGLLRDVDAADPLHPLLALLLLLEELPSCA